MLSDINATTATVPLESTWRLKALQHPSLLFDTYSYVHILSDPDEEKSGGDRGQGKYSDFEFRIDSTTPDSVLLTGIYNESKMVMVRATQEDVNGYISSLAKNAEEFENISNFTTYFKRLKLGEKEYDISLNTERRNITFTYNNGGIAQIFSTTYYFTGAGLQLKEPFSDGEITIMEMSNLNYKTGDRRLNLTSGSLSGTIREASQPVIFDVSAAQRFYSNPPNGFYWYTVYGFTIEGIEDAFNITEIPDYYFTTFYIQPDPPYDGLITFTTGDSFFGPALRTRATNTGKIFFTQEGNFGTAPEEAAPAIDATSQQLTIPEGYYVIPSGDRSYDLVSAKDARAWISFY